MRRRAHFSLFFVRPFVYIAASWIEWFLITRWFEWPEPCLRGLASIRKRRNFIDAFVLPSLWPPSHRATAFINSHVPVGSFTYFAVLFRVFFVPIRSSEQTCLKRGLCDDVGVWNYGNRARFLERASNFSRDKCGAPLFFFAFNAPIAIIASRKRFARIVAERTSDSSRTRVCWLGLCPGKSLALVKRASFAYAYVYISTLYRTSIEYTR